MKKLNHIWVFSDGIIGHEVQSMALANVMAHKVSLFHCSIRQPWLSFAPRILPRFGRNIIWQKNKPDFNQAPEAIIACGRSMAAVSKYYKRKLSCKNIQILNPRDNPKKYDALICPQHDRVKANNIILSLGSLHNVSIQNLDKQVELCQSKDNKYAHKTCAIMLGNPPLGFHKELETLAQSIKTSFPKHELSICASRRTAKKQQKHIQKVFPTAQFWFDKKDGENPYSCLLACSDVFLVTADSINMLSETCATDKPVIALATKYVSPKHQRFVKSIAHRLSKFEEMKSTNKPLEMLANVAKHTLRLIE